MNIFPPFFPSSRYLSKKWWHIFVYFFCLIFSLSSLLSIFSTLLLLLSKIGLILSTKLLALATIPMTIPLYPLSFFFVKDNAPITQATSYNNTLSTLNDFSAFSSSPSLGYIILIGYFIAMVFLPSFIYLLILDSTLGKKWRK